MIFNSGGAPFDGAPVVTVQVGAPPPSNESVRKALARWINDGAWPGGGGSVLDQVRTGRALFIVILDKIVAGKDSNDFLVQIRLYLVKIWKKSKRGRNQFPLRYEI
jgi:hypothetical protein